MEDRSESRLSSFAAYITELSAKSETFQSLILGNTDRDARFNKQNHPIADLSHILTVLDVPGPYDLNFDEGLISSGAQFIVQNSLIGSDEEPGTLYRVAAKTPKFMLDCQERLNLSADSVRRQHPNIVDMIGWGYTTSWHAAPFLALELAQSDLGGLVKEAGESMSFDDQRRIILDIASGLSAIHEIGIVHGDVKPENVLVFQEGGRWSAKLTDFGGGAVLPGKDVRGRGTVGWRAPELQRYHEYDEALNPELLWSIDIYSFGLICGFILCRSAGPSRGGEGERALESTLIHLEGQQGIPDMWRGIYQGLLGACLSQQPQDRPMDILTPLRDAETQMADMDSASQAGMTIQHATCDQEPQHQPVHVRSFQYSRRNWEIPELRGELARDFLCMYLNNESHVSPAQAFGVFMNRQYFILKRFRDTSTRDIYIRLLRTAALGGIMQARSLIFRYYEYFELALRSCINLDTRALQPGISTTEPLNEDGDYLSHVLASFRLPETLEILKTIVTPTTVNLVNAFGESLLYRASLLAFGFEIDSLCLAWDYLWGPETTCTALMLAVYMANMQVAEALLRAGADVNITGSGGQTAIMALGECYSEVELETEDYEFCKALQRQVMLLLLAHGARIDGRSNNGRSPILALAVGHHIGAVEVLLENGAMINDVPVKCGTKQNDRQFPVLHDLAHPTWAIARDIDLADMMRTYALPDLNQAVQIKPDPAGMSILHSFVVRGFIESTGVLLETGINVSVALKEQALELLGTAK
ncbi:hypothetical protein CEP53_000433 [Fusarium sp. AF-6]|nr:hypothetical protein CEP53_000433 [Fusarium sp. AF-6]